MASSGASTLFSSDFSILLGALLTGSLAIYYNPKLNVPFSIAGIFLIAITTYHFFHLGALNLGPLVRMITHFLFGFWVVCLVGKRLYPMVSNLIAWLSVISLPFFLLVLINNDLMFAIFDQLESLLPIPETRAGADMKYANFIVYTIWQPGRNHGFMWEPGAFGAVLSIGVFFNLINNRFKMNWKLIVMIVAMITTFSTTALVLLLLLFLFYIVNRQIYWVIPGLIVLALFVFNLDLVGPKVIHQFTNRTLMMETEQQFSQYGSRSLGRFGSMVADWNDLQQSIFFGIGHNFDLKTSGTYIDLHRTNGFTDYLLKFGIIGILFFIFNLIMTAIALKYEYSFRFILILPILICLLSFSNPVLYLPLFMSFQSYYFKQFQFRSWFLNHWPDLKK